MIHNPRRPLEPLVCPLRARSAERPEYLADIHGQDKMPPTCCDAGHSASRTNSQAGSSAGRIPGTSFRHRSRDGENRLYCAEPTGVLIHLRAETVLTEMIRWAYTDHADYK